VFWTVIMSQNTPSITWDSYVSMWLPLVMQGVSKRALQLLKLIYIYSEDMYNVLNCHNVTKHTEFYLGVPISRSRSYFTTDGQSISMSWYRAPLRDLRPDITSCRKAALWKLRSSFCGAASLTRWRVCNLQCNRSMVQVAQNPKPYFTVSSETPPNLEGQVPVFISPRNRVAQLYPLALGSL
jgi:hypothetical protein